MGKISVENSETKYVADYIIVGVGLAGSVLVGKLSENNNISVIGVEAGNNNIFDIPINQSIYAGVEFGLPNNYYPEYFWQHKPVPNGSLTNTSTNNFCECDNKSTLINCNCIPIEQKQTQCGDYTTGRILGGGSSINGMQYVRGSQGFFEELEKISPKIWSKAKISETYVNLEKYLGLTNNKNIHGYNGPVDIRQAPIRPTIMTQKFIRAIVNSVQINQIPNDDYNDPITPIGPFEKWELFQNPDTTRSSAATAFLGPSIIYKNGKGIDRKNLLILFKTTADKIIWDKKIGHDPIAIGIKVISNGQNKEIYARKSVIICLGIYSSEFLQRSGVGPKKLLKCLNIDLVHDNPNVGNNFTNHVYVPITFSANPNDLSVPVNDLASLYTGGAFLPILLPTDNPSLRGYQLIGASDKFGQFYILLIYLQPHSKGKILIQSSDPLQISLTDNNYFGVEQDLDAFVSAIKVYIMGIATAFQEIDPLYKLQSPTVDVIGDIDKLKQFILNNFNHTHHWMSSNKMSRDCSSGVVDKMGKVFGVKNLMVVDNSISPIQSDGNTAAPIFLFAYRIAEILLEEEMK